MWEPTTELFVHFTIEYSGAWSVWLCSTKSQHAKKHIKCELPTLTIQKKIRIKEELDVSHNSIDTPTNTNRMNPSHLPTSKEQHTSCHSHCFSRHTPRSSEWLFLTFVLGKVPDSNTSEWGDDEQCACLRATETCETAARELQTKWFGVDPYFGSLWIKVMRKPKWAVWINSLSNLGGSTYLVVSSNLYWFLLKSKWMSNKSAADSLNLSYHKKLLWSAADTIRWSHRSLYIGDLAVDRMACSIRDNCLSIAFLLFTHIWLCIYMHCLGAWALPRSQSIQKLVAFSADLP